MSRPLAWLLGLLGLALLTLLCVQLHTPDIERDLQDRTTATLDQRGFTGTAVLVSGRDVTLKGAVPDETARQRALGVASGVPGVRVVRDELRIASDDGAVDEAALFSFAEGPGGALVLRGTVPDEAARESLLENARSAFPDRVIEDELVVGSGTSGWLPSVEALIPGLGSVTDPRISVDPVPPATAGMDGAWVSLRGRVPSEAVKANVESAAAAAVRAPYRFRSELVVEGNEGGDAESAVADSAEGNAAAPADAPSQVEAADAALREVLSGGPIQFELATADLTASSRGVLDRIADVFERFPSIKAEVQGHTDSEDSSEHNLRLSQQRAEAVLAYLTRQGVSADRLTARGYGEDQPIATNDTAEGRAQNRRVVFRLER